MSLLPPLPLTNGCLFVDNSMIELLTTCPRALQYNKLNKRIASVEKTSLGFGSIQHTGLEYRYLKYGVGDVDEQYFNKMADLFSVHFALHPCPEDDFRDLNWALEVNRRYLERYPQEEFSLLQYEKPVHCPHCPDTPKIVVAPNCQWCNGTQHRTLMVEVPFALPLYISKYGPVYYSGKLDLPVSHNNQLWVLDHKTTKMLGPQFWKRMQMSAQQKGYCWAMEQVLKTKITGYIVNAIRVLPPPQYVTAGTSHKGKSMSPQKWWEESLQRQRFYLSDGSLIEWKNNIIHLVDEFFYHYDKDYMPRKTEWCAQFGQCQYFDVCSVEESSRDVMLASGAFTDNKWSPLKEPTQAKQ